MIEVLEKELSKGWILASLHDVSESLFAGGDVPKNNLSKVKTEQFNIPIFGNGIKDDGLYGYTDIIKVSDDCITISARGTIGYSVLRTGSFYPIVRLIVLIPCKGIDVRYLKYTIDNNKFADSGSSIPQLTIPMVREVKIPLAPLAEQNRIVAKLDKLFASLENTKTRLGTIPQLIKNFKQAVLTQAVTGKLTEQWREGKELENMNKFIKDLSIQRKNKYEEAVLYAKKNKLKKPKKDFEFEYQSHSVKKDWSVAKLENLIYMSARIGWKGLKAEEYTSQGPLFLSVHGLNHGENVNFDVAYHITEERYGESPEIMLEEDDILLCKDGAGIGKLGVVKDLKEKATVNSSLLVIRGREALNYKFLYYFFAGPALQNIAKERITGTAIPHLFQKDIKDFCVEIPPLAEQTEIVRRVESLFAKADAIEAQYNKLKQKVDTLPQALLAKAFRGELVAQNPLDEPASVLLEKINSLREAEGKGINGKAKLQRKKKLKEAEPAEVSMAAEPKAKYN